MEPGILCIGHASHDLTFFLGEFPRENRKYTVSEWKEAGGGPAANAACLCASWGAATAFAGVVGDDASGRLVVAEFRSAGVDLSGLEIRPGHPTPLSSIIVNRAAGSRTIMNRRIPTAPLQLGAADRTSFRPAVLLFDGHELEASLEAMERFPEASTILDAGSLREATGILAGRVDWPICSESFALEITGMTAVESPEEIRTCLRRIRNVIGKDAAVTRGERGLVFAGDGETWTLPALPVTAADTTAAGDIFHGAFAYGQLRGETAVQAFRRAVVAAGISVTRPGGRDSIPSREETETALLSFEGMPQPL